jgi:hypothetical protein
MTEFAQWVTVDLSRLRTAFSALDPQARDQVARALRDAYPNLLVTPLPSGVLDIELIGPGSGAASLQLPND